MDFFQTRKKLEVLVIFQGFVRWQDKGQSSTEGIHILQQIRYS